ncbi:hypothetical protein ACWFMI_20945 [Nocardiopsis terrae]
MAVRKKLPGRDVLELTVRAWGGDPAYWLTRRREVEAALSKATVLRLQMTRAQGTQNSTTQDNNSPMRTRQIRRISEIPVSSHFDALRSQRIDDARQALGKMGFDSARSSERSAYVLLSLLNLKPEQEWKNAQMPILRLTEMMEWIREEYKRVYAPNTQEMMRSLIIRGFVDSGLIIQNPDNPDRPINSSRWCYQIAQPSHALLRSYGTPDFDRQTGEHRRSQV